MTDKEYAEMVDGMEEMDRILAEAEFWDDIDGERDDISNSKDS